MRVTAPSDAFVPDLVAPMLKADPSDPSAGQVTKGQAYEVPDKVGKSLVAQGWKQSGASSSKPRTAKGDSKP